MEKSLAAVHTNACHNVWFGKSAEIGMDSKHDNPVLVSIPRCLGEQKGELRGI